MRAKVIPSLALLVLATFGVIGNSLVTGTAAPEQRSVVTVPFEVPAKPKPAEDVAPPAEPAAPVPAEPADPNDKFQIADSDGTIIDREIERPVGTMLTLRVVGVPTPFDSDKPVPRVGWIIVPLTKEVRTWYDGYVIDFTSEKAGSYLFIASRNADDPLEYPLRRPIVVRFVDGSPSTPTVPVDPDKPPTTPTDPTKPTVPRVTKVTYVYEKDKNAIPSAVAGAMDKLNRAGTTATMIDKDIVDGDGQIPDQYKVAIGKAIELSPPNAFVPAVISEADGVVIKTFQNPKTEADVVGVTK